MEAFVCRGERRHRRPGDCDGGHDRSDDTTNHDLNVGTSDELQRLTGSLDCQFRAIEADENTWHP